MTGAFSALDSTPDKKEELPTDPDDAGNMLREAYEEVGRQLSAFYSMARTADASGYDSIREQAQEAHPEVAEKTLQFKDLMELYSEQVEELGYDEMAEGLEARGERVEKLLNTGENHLFKN